MVAAGTLPAWAAAVPDRAERPKPTEPAARAHSAAHAATNGLRMFSSLGGFRGGTPEAAFPARPARTQEGADFTDLSGEIGLPVTTTAKWSARQRLGHGAARWRVWRQRESLVVPGKEVARAHQRLQPHGGAHERTRALRAVLSRRVRGRGLGSK